LWRRPREEEMGRRSLLVVLGATSAVLAGQVGVKGRPAVRIYGVGSYVEGVGLQMDGGGMVEDPVWATIERFAPAWAKLHDCMKRGIGQDADGAAANHSPDAREEAANKLISNHERVLRDITDLMPRTQPELGRVPLFDAPHVDQMLREVSRRLIGRRGVADDLPDAATPSTVGQSEAWAQTATYLYGRIQATPGEKPGREPDMSVAAANALREVLQEVGNLAMNILAAFEEGQHATGARA